VSIDNHQTENLCLRVAFFWVAVIAIGCGSREKLLPVSLPDLSRVDQSVQAQARERYAALTRKMNSSVAPADLATAYGELGMVLQAAE